MIKKWSQSLDKGEYMGTPDCLSHDLMIAKLHANGFDVPALRLVHNYLIHKKQSAKMDHAFSSQTRIQLFKEVIQTD